MIDLIKQWWRSWRDADADPLQRYGKHEVERMAHDLCLSGAEFCDIAQHGPDAADPLERRMKALDLDSSEVAAIEPSTFRDLQRLCTFCASHKKCMKDLAHDPGAGAWQDYCPNAAALKELDALPWASRREW